MPENDTSASTMTRPRFGIKSLMLVTAAVCVACALYLYARNFYYAERREAQDVLADIKGISFTIEGFHDVVEEVSRINVSVNKHPKSIIQLGNLNRYQAAGAFSISRIGKWRFAISGRRKSGAFVAATGEPVESQYHGGHIELGPHSPYNKLIPFELNTLQELVDHYQDLVALFESWPRESQPGQVTLDDGSIQHFHVVEDGDVVLLDAGKSVDE
jgi:hypothetical protein